MIPMSRWVMDRLFFTMPASEYLRMWCMVYSCCTCMYVEGLTYVDNTHVQCSRCNTMILDSIHVRVHYLCTYSKITLPLGKSWTTNKLITTALHSRFGLLDVVRYLVTEAHCDPNVKDNDGLTPLHYACQ